MSYSLRIDGSLAAVLAWLASYSIGGWCVRETTDGEGGNEHWHFHLFTEKTIKQLRCSFNRAVPELKGNGGYSLTEVRDADAYDAYMAKGNSESEMPEVAWRNSLDYDDAKVTALHDEYWQENRARKKKKLGSMIDWCVDECKRLNVDWNDRRQIAKIYIREVGARGKPINLFAIRSNLNAVQFALCGNDDCLNSLVDRCEQY